jgi:hypothetical protein
MEMEIFQNINVCIYIMYDYSPNFPSSLLHLYFLHYSIPKSVSTWFIFPSVGKHHTVTHSTSLVELKVRLSATCLSGTAAAGNTACILVRAIALGVSGIAAIARISST